MTEQTADDLGREGAMEAIRLLGGPVEAARKLDIAKYQAVQSWRDNGVPVRYCRRINEFTGISLQRLRPSDWRDYWPELADAATSGFGQLAARES